MAAKAFNPEKLTNFTIQAQNVSGWSLPSKVFTHGAKYKGKYKTNI